MHNPSLRSQPLEQLAPVIPPKQNASILNWLEGTGRLMERDIVEGPGLEDEEEMEEITALMGDADYDDDDGLED